MKPSVKIVHNTIESPSKFNYPLEELKSITSKFEYSPFSSSLENEFNYQIDSFINKLSYEFNVPYWEKDKVKLTWLLSSNNIININCTNLFTACLMFGYYVPLPLLDGLKEFTLPDNSIIKYDQESNSYILIPKAKPVCERCSNGFCNKPENESCYRGGDYSKCEYLSYGLCSNMEPNIKEACKKIAFKCNICDYVIPMPMEKKEPTYNEVISSVKEEITKKMWKPETKQVPIPTEEERRPYDCVYLKEDGTFFRICKHLNRRNNPPSCGGQRCIIASGYSVHCASYECDSEDRDITISLPSKIIEKLDDCGYDKSKLIEELLIQYLRNE